MNPIKKIITACFLMLCIYSHAQEVPPLTINVATAGTLSSVVPYSKKYQTRNLILTGNINGTDIRYLREMIGYDQNGNRTEGILSILDMSGVNIVAGNVYFVTKPNSIVQGMFAGFKELTSLTLPNSVTTIENAAFTGCSGLKILNIGSNVTFIGNDAFSGCSRLTSLMLPNKLKSIGSGAFWGCSGLTSLIIPDSTSLIGDFAFYNCEELTTITFPNSLKVIGDQSFKGCQKITEIFCKASIPPKVPSGAFSVNSTCKLYIPKGTYNDYWLAICWGDFKNIIEQVTTSISNIESNKINAYSENGSLIVKGGKLGDIINIYNISGLLLHKIKITDDIVRVNVAPQSFYIVKTGNKTFKIAL